MSGIEAHYDARVRLRGTQEALQARRAGVLYSYKRYANDVKRQLIRRYAKGPLIDLGCGCGGDLFKWRDADIRCVVAIDLSSAQLEEARRRERADRRRTGMRVVWCQQNMLDPELLTKLAPHATAGGADAVAAMFCVQFAFGSEEDASLMLSHVSALLRPGGIFFGTAPDGDALLALLDGGQQAEFGPPEWPFALHVRRTTRGGREFGQGVFFSLEDTVTQDSDARSDAHEYLVRRETLVRMASVHGLQPLSIETMYQPEAGLTEHESRVAQLYFTFAFRKEVLH